MRLNRYLAQCGVASRRAADELITARRVRVNGAIVTNLATQVEPGTDRVEFGGHIISITPTSTHIVMNKPPGCDVTRDDPHSRTSVFKYLPRDLPGSVQYVGRLDRETTGLLLFTNDGELANRLTHPSHGIEKEYLCFGPNAPTRDQLDRLVGIINLDDGPARAKRADAVHAAPPEELALPRGVAAPLALRIVIHLGRKRIVRRMCEAVGFTLTHLHRTRLGPLGLGHLAVGKFRNLTGGEIAALRRAAKLDAPSPTPPPGPPRRQGRVSPR